MRSRSRLSLRKEGGLDGCAYVGRWASLADVAGEERVGGAAGEAVIAARFFDERGELVAVGGRSEGVRGEAGFVVGDEVGEVLADEAQEGRARALFEEEWLGGEEARAGSGGGGGHAIDGCNGVGDAGQEGRAENAGGKAGFAQAAHGGEAEVRAGRAGFEQSGEHGVGCGDGEVQDEGIGAGDLGEKVDVTLDEARFSDEADAQAGASGEDLEKRTGDPGGALNGLVGVGRGADGDLVGGVVLAKFLFQEPGRIFLEVDLALEGSSPGLHFIWAGGDGRGLQEFVSVAGVAVTAGELAAAVRIDRVGEGEPAAGGGAVEDSADVKGAEFDVVAVGDVSGFGGHAGEARWCGREDGEEGCGRVADVYHTSPFIRLSRT